MYTVHIAPCPGAAHAARSPDETGCSDFRSLREAVLWARAVAQRGLAVVAIRGCDGAYLSRRELASSITPSLWLADARALEPVQARMLEAAAARHIQRPSRKL
jgi:hypothetical protein